MAWTIGLTSYIILLLLQLCVCYLNLTDVIEMLDEIEYFIPFEVCYARPDTEIDTSEMDSIAPGEIDIARRTCIMAEVHLSAAPSSPEKEVEQRIKVNKL